MIAIQPRSFNARAAIVSACASGKLVGLITRKDLLQVRASITQSEGERRAYFSPASLRGRG